MIFFRLCFQVLHHPTTIAVRYQAMVHCGPIRQTASILNMDADCLRTGDKANVHFKYVHKTYQITVPCRLNRLFGHLTPQKTP